MYLAKLKLNILNYDNNMKERRVEEKGDDETASITHSDNHNSMNIDESIHSSPRISDLVHHYNYRSTTDYIPLGLENDLLLSPRKSVRFSNKVHVVFINCLNELGLNRHSIWWSMAEIDSFKAHAFEEIRQYVVFHGCSIKEGLTHLYQSTEDNTSFTSYDKKNRNLSNS